MFDFPYCRQSHTTVTHAVLQHTQLFIRDDEHIRIKQLVQLGIAMACEPIVHQCQYSKVCAR